MKSAPPSSTGSTATDAIGAEGNSRLTAVNGTTLVALLAVEGVTVLDVRGMITLHVYLGLLLVGPVLLKCASTLYRSCATTPARSRTCRRGLRTPYCVSSAHW